MLLDFSQSGNKLTISYWGEGGELCVMTKKLSDDMMFNWKVCGEDNPEKDPVYRNWDGRPVRKHWLPYKENGRTVNQMTPMRIAEIIDDLPKEDYDKIFSYNIPRIVFIDIETEIDEDFPKPEEARLPITCIGFTMQDHKVYVYGTRPLDARDRAKVQEDIDRHTEKLHTKFEFIYREFPDEASMLKHFLSGTVQHFPMMSGWNFISFDWAYICNRAVKLGIDPDKSSPIGKMVGKDVKVPVHRGIIDYMECYRKWDTNVEQKENYKLNQAGYDVLGVEKVHYSGSLQDLYEQDFPKYIYYNAIDCILVEMLHEKLGVSTIGCTLAYIAKTQATKMFSPVALTENIIARDFYKLKKVCPPISMDGRESEGYDGAYVKQPKTGFHRCCICNDFASLYPNIIRELNLSPETFVTKIDEDDDVAREKWLKKGFIVSRSGCVFKKEPGVFSTLVGRVYNQRKEYKNKSYIASKRVFKLLELADDVTLSDEEALEKMREILND